MQDHPGNAVHEISANLRNMPLIAAGFLALATACSLTTTEPPTPSWKKMETTPEKTSYGQAVIGPGPTGQTHILQGFTAEQVVEALVRTGLLPNQDGLLHDEESWRAGFQAGKNETVRKHFHHSYVHTSCFPQGHMCVTSTSSRTTMPISVCTRCGQTVIHGEPSDEEMELLTRMFGRRPGGRNP